MKLNPKIYKSITGEPFMVQKIDGVGIEFYYMEENPIFNQYKSKGRFALWTSDGINYRVIVEKTYFEALNKFYEEPVNKIWVNFLNNVGKMSTKMSLLFTIPTIVLYIIAAVIALMFFQDSFLIILLVMVIFVITSNMIRGQIVNKKAYSENSQAQTEIKDYLGEGVFDELVKKQEEHYKAYFNIQEEAQDEEITNIEDLKEVNDENDRTND